VKTLLTIGDVGTDIGGGGDVDGTGALEREEELEEFAPLMKLFPTVGGGDDDEVVGETE